MAEQKVAALEARVAELEERVTELEGELAVKEETNSVLEGDIANLRKEVRFIPKGDVLVSIYWLVPLSAALRLKIMRDCEQILWACSP